MSARSYQYQFYPSVTQAAGLRDLLATMCDWYNSCLEDRISSYRRTGRSPTCYDQEKSLRELRQDSTYGQWTHATYVQVCRQVDQTYKKFLKGGGFPRFRVRSRFRTLTMVVGKGARRAGSSLSLTSIPGDLRINWHRPLPQGAKCQRVRITQRLGKWFATFLVEADFHEACGEGDVGVDLGLTSITATSDGDKKPTPRLERRASRRVRVLQRALARCKRGSRRRVRARERLARASARVARQRSDYAHKLSRALVSRYKRIAFEDLRVKSMVRSRRFARSIHDAAWSQIVAYTTYKAESAGGVVVRVDPAYTSQTCPGCGRIERKPLSLRRHLCSCGVDLDRDVAAAIVIRDRAFGRPAGARLPDANVVRLEGVRGLGCCDSSV